ncbi:hypothetical protein OQX61_13735 [Pedobacter sp. PLR]|nr:hypothetical protein [Pedobacter sp. PLR]
MRISKILIAGSVMLFGLACKEVKQKEQSEKTKEMEHQITTLLLK